MLDIFIKAGSFLFPFVREAVFGKENTLKNKLIKIAYMGISALAVLGCLFLSKASTNLSKEVNDLKEKIKVLDNQKQKTLILKEPTKETPEGPPPKEMPKKDIIRQKHHADEDVEKAIDSLKGLK
jgi:hypothetical protein